MRVWSSMSACGLLVACACLAPGADGTFQITGAVLDSQTGAPVKGALVTARGLPSLTVQRPNPNGPEVYQPPKTPVQPAPVLTDASGAYQFTGLDAGSYFLQADKPGYTFTYGQKAPAPIELGPSREDYKLYLSPLAKIRGKVISRDGEPVPGVVVRILSAPIQDGRRNYVELR